jgi:hypothetical protein
VLERTALSILNTIDYKDMKEFVERGEYTIDVPTGAHLKMEMSLFDTVLRCIGARNWLLYRCNPEKIGFITSDHRVILSWSEPNKGIYPPGFGIPGTEVIFPVANSMLMCGSFEGEEGTRDLNDAQIGVLNSIVAAYAERQIYARDKDFFYVTNGVLRTGAQLTAEPDFVGDFGGTLRN